MDSVDKRRKSSSSSHEVVEHAEWVERRKELLEAEKRAQNAMAEVAAQRRALPWERVSAHYRFRRAGSGEEVGLEALFPAGQRTLVVQHVMHEDG